MKIVSQRQTIWLLSRLVVALAFIPKIQSLLFVPFLTTTALHPFDPWSHWLTTQGRSDAFPYGPIMYLTLWPASIIGHVISNLTTLDQSNVTQILLILTLLLVDYLVCKTIGAFSDIRNAWSFIYILAPLPLFISYIHGQLDLIPTAYLLAATQFIRKEHWQKAGILLGLGIAAKFSLVLILPFLLLYFVYNQNQIKYARQFFFGLVPTGTLALIPAIWSPGFRKMVLGTPEVMKALAFSLNLGSVRLLILPIAYVILFLWLWNLGRVTSFVLIAFVGAALTTVATMQTSSVGWYFWGIPLVASVLKRSSTRTLILFFVWQVTVAMYYLSNQEDVQLRFIGHHIFSVNETALTLIFTINLVLSLALIAKVLSESITQGDIFGVGRKPLAISIAGDSGVGKDTLTKALSNAFGDGMTTILLGDDYHLHERGDSSWLTTTHLDPEANNLEEWGRHFRKALNREKVFARHYDHGVGRFTLAREIRPNDLILLNGLHAQLIPSANEIDLKVFLSMNESLRVDLKMKRDLQERSHIDREAVLHAISNRKQHFENFIQPQQKTADLLIHLSPITMDPLRISIGIRTPNQTLVREIHRAVISLSNTPTFLERKDGGELWLTVDAESLSNEDNIALMHSLIKSPEQIVGSGANILAGEKGFMAVICLVALSRKRLEKYARS